MAVRAQSGIARAVLFNMRWLMMEHPLPDEGPRRRLTLRDQIDCVPVYVVWETTLACNLKCLHCGSRAGHRRANELNTAECIDVIRQLAELGTREVTIIGGEAFIRRAASPAPIVKRCAS